MGLGNFYPPPTHISLYICECKKKRRKCFTRVLEGVVVYNIYVLNSDLIFFMRV